MKFVIIGTAYPWRGGIAQSNDALLRNLNKGKHEAKLFTFTYLYPSIFFPNKSFRDKGPGPKDLPIIPIISSMNPFTWFSVAKKAEEENPDVIIFRYWVPFLAPCIGTIMRLCRKKTRAKIICLVDQVYPHEKRLIDSVMAGFVLRAADGFISFSEAVAKKIRGMAKSPIMVSPLPLYENFGDKLSKVAAAKHIGARPGKRRLLFFGFIRRYKGLDILLEAMADPRVRRLDIELQVVGEFFDPREPYDRQVERLALKNNVIFKSEYITSDAVRYYFCAADMVMQPYRAASQSAVTPVAYHFERPMLVTDVGGLPEIVPDGVVGYVVKPEAKAIADAIVDFYAKKREVGFSAGVRREKKKLLWVPFIKRLEDLIRKV